MCGIAGFQGDFDPGLLERMADSMSHRGPDDHGTWYGEGHRTGLAHRRLSIIDLSPRGHQPMWDPTGTVVCAYNGEIYNYRELRAELVADGFRFDSDCDTEVLLNLYLRDGVKCLERLNGIFAFGLWDRRSGELLLARDGMGVKPLYYAETSRGLAFASELKSLLQDGSVDRTLDAEAIQNHLIYLWCPSPLTMLREVRKLPPGHALLVGEGRVKRQWSFYDLPFDEEFVDWPEFDAVVQVRKHLQRAIDRQLVSDVPVGAFLSGGLDSSSIVALAQRRLREPMKCFTIGFQDAEARAEGMAADLPYATQVAEHLGAELHTIWVESKMIEDLPRMLFHLDEPQADLAPINALYISQLAQQHGIRVLLSGTGGDDVFTGYRRHYALAVERWWSWLPQFSREFVSDASQRLRPINETRRRVAKALRYAHLRGDARIESYFWWIAPELVAPLFSDEFRPSFDPDRRPVQQALGSLPDSTPALNRMLYLEGKFFLADHNLNYTDKVSMASGVEVRVPLLDPDLVRLAAKLPLHLKQRGRTGKWVLRKAMEPYLPRNVIHREKTGFGAPLRHWLRNDLRPLVEEVLSERSLRERGIFDPKAVRSLVQRNSERQIDATYTIFSMICVELWCRMFVDGETPECITGLP